MSLCLLTPDLPIMPERSPVMAEAGYLCSPQDGVPAAAYGLSAPHLAASNPGQQLAAHARAGTVSSDLGDG